MKDIKDDRDCLTMRCSEIEPHGAFGAGSSLRFANQFVCSVKSFSGSIH